MVSENRLAPLPLIERLPRLTAELPWIRLGEWPTKVAYLPELSRTIGTDIWIKQDNESNAVYGGNKVRKLEILLAAAKEKNCRSLLTVGGIGSNNTIACAIFGNKLGLRTHAVVLPQPITPEVRSKIHLANKLGVNLIPCSNKYMIFHRTRQTFRLADQPYFIPPGSSSPLGTLGFVAAVLELKQQIETGLLPEPDAIFVPLGSGGTMAGLLVGCSLAGLRSQIIGVRVVEKILCNGALVQLLAWRTRRLIKRFGEPIGRHNTRMTVINTHFGGKYGRPTPEGEAAINLAYETQALKLDSTYTGKTLAALHEFCKTQTGLRCVLFWNTYNSQPTEALGNTADHVPLPSEIQNWLSIPS
ncbi:MAG: pyridoxal-phosphate dependent enzyme [Pseudomonadota bacterium]